MSQPIESLGGDPSPLEGRVSGFRPKDGYQDGPPSTAKPLDQLRFGTMLAYSTPGLIGAAMVLLIAVYLTKFYVDAVLMPAGVLAVAVAVCRAFDAMIDPFVGYLSDHTHSRWGRRKPWIVAGVLGNVTAFYLLLTPPSSLTPNASILWFTACFATMFLSYSMSTVPRLALSVELTFDVQLRHKLYGLATSFIALGMIFGAITPTILQGRGLIDPRSQMEAAATIYVVGYLLLNLFFLYYVPERKEFMGRGETPFVPGARRALRNSPFRIMFTSHVITAIPMAIPAVLVPFFTQYVLKLDGVKWTGIYVLTYLTSGFLALPIWLAITRKYGKLRVWLMASFIGVSGSLGYFFLHPGDTLWMLALQAYAGVASTSAVWLFIGTAMHADVIDYDELHSGKRREAQFSSLWTIIPKFALIPGAALPLAALGAAGYVPNKADQLPEVILTLRVLYSLVPAALNGIGLALMWWYPLTEKRHAEIREGVAKHARGETVIDPITGRNLPPPSLRTVDEATGWFLDYFSKRELRGLIQHGSGVLTSVLAWGGAFAALSIASAVYAVTHLRGANVNPGPLPTLAIVCSGLCFSGLMFHALRIKPALRLVHETPPAAVIKAHLDAVGDS
jgi:GPH family glycoside/pentoside/hexuronide:cation symporter